MAADFQVDLDGFVCVGEGFLDIAIGLFHQSGFGGAVLEILRRVVHIDQNR